jgi:hypothetical protein
MSKPKVTAPQVEVKTYKNEKAFEKDAKGRLAAGWQVEGQTAKPTEVAKLRTVGKVLATGGLGLAVGGRSKKGGGITVTWVKHPT